MACIPCETQSVTSVASFVASAATAVVVLAVALVGKEVLSVLAVDTLTAVLDDVSDDRLPEVHPNVLFATVSALKFDIPAPSDNPSSSAPLDSSTDATSHRDHSLQASMPSDHVCSCLESPALPHFPNQDPPRLQQLLLPDFLMMPHLEHTAIVSGILAVGVWM